MLFYIPVIIFNCVKKLQFFIHPLVDLGCFCFLTIMGKAAMNISVQVFMWT